MTQATALLGLITETSLHAGAGSSAGVIDLPIQREAHNDWPCVFGSSVKGALRSRGETMLGQNREEVFTIFGPDTSNAADHAGALAVGDARLLLLPVRSLTSAFRWVTCPEALCRLQRDAARLGLAECFSFTVPSVTADEALVVPSVAADKALVASGTGNLFLEEYRFTQEPNDAVAAMVPFLACLLKRDNAKDELSQRLTLVSNDTFSHLVRAAVPINPHIALDAGSKTVIDGALWYEETLPPETVLYLPLIAFASRNPALKLTAQEVLTKATGLFPKGDPWLQLGGNETVGMGWCAVSVLSAVEG